MTIYNVVSLREGECAYVDVYSFLSKESAEEKMEDIYAELQDEEDQSLSSTREENGIRAWADGFTCTISINEQEVEE